MNEQTLVITIGGLLLLTLGGFASYMADRQKKQKQQERKIRRAAASA
jgi:hypothetical protein